MKRLLMVPLFLGAISISMAQEKPVTKAEAKEIVRKALNELDTDWDMTRIYGQAGNDIPFCVRALESLRTSKASADTNVQSVIASLELKLDSSLLTFLAYRKEQKRHKMHRAFVTFIERAKTYREKYPMKRNTEDEKTIGRRVELVFEYAKEEKAKLEKAQKEGRPSGLP